jgi:16S rRNA (uracil1498-N3)-methyltransferase
MPAERYYIENDIKKDHMELLLDGQEFHHLYHVMRAKKGETVEIINGKGILAHGLIEEITKKQALIKIISLQVEPQKFPKIILAQAIPRINRLDFIVEKCTELGMHELWLFPGVHSERKDLTTHQLERLKSLTIAAIKQSGRLWLPEIKLQPPLLNWKESPLPGFFGDLSPEASYLSHLLIKNPIQDNAIFFTGPESGFNIAEEEKLKQLGAQGAKLHEAILRTDTASILAISTFIISRQHVWTRGDVLQ